MLAREFKIQYFEAIINLLWRQWIHLVKDVCNINDISNISGFAWKSIQDILLEMSASNLIETLDSGKRGRSYFLKSLQNIKNLLAIEELRFPNWRKVYDTLGLLWETISNPCLAELSEKTFRSEIKRLFEEEIKENLLTSDLESLKFCTADSIESLPLLIEEIS